MASSEVVVVVVVGSVAIIKWFPAVTQLEILVIYTLLGGLLLCVCVCGVCVLCSGTWSSEVFVLDEHRYARSFLRVAVCCACATCNGRTVCKCLMKAGGFFGGGGKIMHFMVTHTLIG